MNRSLTSKLYLKQHLYSHRLLEDGFLEDYPSLFKEIVIDLETIEVKYDEKYLGLILLSSLLASYMRFMDTILYGRDTLTNDEI